MSILSYLQMRHDMVAKTLFKKVTRKNYQEVKLTKEISDPEHIQKFGDYERWWNFFIKAVQKVS